MNEETNYYPLYDYLSTAKDHVRNDIDEPKFFPQFQTFVDFKSIIPDIDNIQPDKLFGIVRDSIEDIVNDIIQNDSSYNQVILNKNFIEALSRVMNSIPVNYGRKVCCNKIFYDALCVGNIDKVLYDYFMQMAKVVNFGYIQQLVTIGISEQMACELSVCRFSSTKEYINIQRVNFYIEQQDQKIMTEQKIVSIYEKLFDHVRELFIGTMLETYSDEQMNTFSESFLEIYGFVGLAILKKY